MTEKQQNGQRNLEYLPRANKKNHRGNKWVLVRLAKIMRLQMTVEKVRLMEYYGELK